MRSFLEITNKSRKVPISKKAQIADTFMSRLAGLMLSPPCDMVLEFPAQSVNRCSIHTCFMRFPINLIWVNKDMVVVDIAYAPPLNPLNPETFKIYKPKEPALYVIELCAEDKNPGDIKDIVKIGDRVEFKRYGS